MGNVIFGVICHTRLTKKKKKHRDKLRFLSFEKLEPDNVWHFCFINDQKQLINHENDETINEKNTVSPEYL